MGSMRRLAILALALAMLGLPAPARSAGGDLYARMQAANASLRSYQATLHVDVKLNSFPFISPSLEGVAYFKRPDKNAVVFNTVPVLAQQFKKVYPQIEPPSDWPELYDVTPGPDNGTTAQFRLVRKKNGRIDHVDVTVDDATAMVTSETYVYKDGGSIAFTQTYDQIDGDYVIASQSGKVDVPHYNANVSSTFSNYKLNVDVPDDVFAP
jgi:outer membrane lipoprotein-sorting protein